MTCRQKQIRWYFHNDEINAIVVSIKHIDFIGCLPKNLEFLISFIFIFWKFQTGYQKTSMPKRQKPHPKKHKKMYIQPNHLSARTSERQVFFPSVIYDVILMFVRWILPYPMQT